MADRIEEAKQAGFTIEEIAASLLKESDRLQARVEALEKALEMGRELVKKNTAADSKGYRDWDVDEWLEGNVSESTTVIVGVQNMAIADPRALRTYDVTSFTVPSENTAPSHPLNEGAVRVGNSLLSARVPESAILRDEGEDCCQQAAGERKRVSVMADLLTSDEDRAAAQNVGYGIADCGLAAGMWGNKFVADLASDVETLQARVEALSAALREMDAAAEQTIRTFDCDGRNYSLTRRLREAREAARKALEGK